MSEPIDILIGKKIKQYRLVNSMSQECLAKKLGITFQQVQKYEKGINRISAGRLHKTSSILKRNISDFFESDYLTADFQTETSDIHKLQDSGKMQDFYSEESGHADSREILSLLKAYNKIRNQKTRHSISFLAKAMLSQQNED